jgi:hypothetical protein
MGGRGVDAPAFFIASRWLKVKAADKRKSGAAFTRAAPLESQYKGGEMLAGDNGNGRESLAKGDEALVSDKRRQEEKTDSGCFATTLSVFSLMGSAIDALPDRRSVGAAATPHRGAERGRVARRKPRRW